MKRSVFLVVAVLVAAPACGGESAARDGGGSDANNGGDLRGADLSSGGAGADGGWATSGAFSCDITVGGFHACTEYTWSGGPFDPSVYQASCSGAKGIPGTSCSKVGVTCGCRITSMMGLATFTTTSWLYGSTFDACKSACLDSKGEVITP